MNKLPLIKKVLLLAIPGLLMANFAFAQTVSLTPATSNVSAGANFSLAVNIASVTNLFGVAFDLGFSPSLLNYVSATEGNFMNQGCSTSMMATQNPAGKLIFGITRLGQGCGGVSGSGTLATLNFQAQGTAGTSALTFSNSQFCLLSGSACNYINGTWNGASVTVQGTGDTMPPAAPIGLTVR